MGLAFGIVLSFAGTAIGIVRPCPQLDCWPYRAEASASGLTSASCYHVEENVLVAAIVKTILKLSEVQRQILLAHVVIRAEYSALEQRPERLDAVRMDFTAHVFAFAMINSLVRQIAPSFQVLIARVFIGRDQLNVLFVHDLIDESIERRHIRSLDHFADQISFPADRPDNRNLVARTAHVPFLVPMAILVLATDIGFVNFDGAEQLSQPVILHRRANTHHHVPSRAVVARSDLAMDLKRADSLLALSHQVDDLKPSRERIVGILENGFRDDAESVAVTSAAILVLADPVPRLRFKLVDLFALAA